MKRKALVKTRRPLNRFLVAAFSALSSLSVCNADALKVLIVGSTSDLGDKYASDSAAFSPTKIATELDNIITQNGPGNATVTVEERFNNNLPTGFVYNSHTFPSDCYNLTGWFHYPLPAGSESNRWANLRGEDGTAWDYVVIIGDPYTMEKTPGMYAQGVAVVAEEVAKGTAEPILLMNWPAGSSYSSVDHYKEVVYRAGRSGGIKVAPAALAWQAAGSPTGGTHPSDDGAYIAAASIYSRIYNQSASNSGYTYNDPLADTVHTAVTNHVGQPQYSGTFNFTNPYLMLGDTRRDVHFSEKGSSTEEDFKNAAKAAMDRCRVTYNTIDYCPNGSSSSATYNSNTPEDDGLGWPVGNSMPIAWNHGRSFPDGKKWVLNTNYWQLGFGYEYQWNTTAYSDEIANDHYIAMMDYYDTSRANAMLSDAAVGARWIPTRMLWAQMHREYPALDPMRDSNHLNWDQTHAIGTYMYTLYSGRCPLDPEPSPMTSRWMAQKIGYETAWRMGHCQTRAPGFKVLPSTATATNVTPVSAETLSVQFIMAPLSNVTVTVTTDDRLKGKVSPSRLTFTPANYQVAQTVTVLGETGGAGSFAFDVLLTTSSVDPVYDGLSDAWTYVNTRPEGPIPPDIQIRGNDIPIEAGDTTPDIADGTDFGAATAPVTRAFTIKNLSDSATLTFSDSPRVTLTSGSGNFTLTQDAATSIAPLGSTTFEITYDAAGGVHTAQVSVASSDANLATYTFDIVGFSPGVPTVINQGATGGQLSATLEGQLSDGGTADATIYWGTTDGGTTPGNWDHAVPIAAVTQGNNFATELTGLVAGRQYYYRSYASNSEGSDWADSTVPFMTAPPPALPITMVRWGAPSREDVVTANTSKNATGTYDPAVPRSPTVGGAAGYYVTDISNRTEVIYGAHQGLLEIRESGSADYAWLAKYMSIGDTMKAMFVWRNADFMADRSVTVTGFKLVMGGPTSLAYTNRWVVEKAGQFYISDQTFTTGTFDVDASTLTWREYTPLNSGSDTIGDAATISLYDLDSVGFYLNVERLTGDPGWQRPTFEYFAVDGDEDPDLSATVNYVNYVAGPNGSITGTGTQEVLYDGSTTPVTATPTAGYEFVNWSDGSTANPRSDTHVTSSQTYTANFAQVAVWWVGNEVLPTDGLFVSQLENTHPAGFRYDGPVGALNSGLGQSFRFNTPRTLRAITLHKSGNLTMPAGTHEVNLWIGEYDSLTDPSNHSVGTTLYTDVLDVSGRTFTNDLFCTINLAANIPLAAGVEYAFQLVFDTLDTNHIFDVHRYYPGSQDAYSDGTIVYQQTTGGMVPFQSLSNEPDNDMAFALHASVVGEPSSMDVWADGYGIRGMDAVFDADPDGDGVVNLGEYAFGGDPGDVGDSGYQPGWNLEVEGAGPNDIEYIYTRRRDAAARGLRYTVEKTEQLTPAVWSTNGIIVAGTKIVDSDFETVSNRVSADRVFLRCKIELEP